MRSWGASRRVWPEGQQGAPSSLFSPSELECCAQFSYPQFKVEKELLERGQWGSTKMVRDVEHLSYAERLWELDKFSLEKT